MAMVLDAFASYVQNMLAEMATEEVHLLLGVAGEIDKLGVKLGDLKNFLADADRRNITDKSVQKWVGQLKRALYDATDILDLCQLKVMEQGPSTLNVGCFNPLLFCMQNPLHAHDISSRIKSLNERLDTVKERSVAFNFINLGSYEDRRSMMTASRLGNTRHDRESTGEFDRSGAVGEKIKEDTRTLVEMILAEKEGNNNIMVVALVGVGGIGKTTLAQKVFNDDSIKDKFDNTIWLSINQDFDKVELLKTAIILAGGDHHSEKALAILRPALTAALTGKKVFLVLDDVWNHTAWQDVLRTPFVNATARGTRVLVTTRDERVARGMKAMLPYHHVDKLEEDDAWSLLKKQVVSSEIDEPDIDMLKDIGLKILAKCGGLPLAVKVMGGLLCQKGKKRRDWEMVLEDSSVWSESKMPEELNYAVYLSYEDLPPYLKQCFLHYSLLPNNTSIFVNEIVGMWISEGFVHGTSDKLEELGEEYYKELISRNLIDPVTGFIGQWVCKMHDIVRSFAQYVARDEALAAHSGETGIIERLSAQKFLRLCLQTEGSEPEELQCRHLQEQKSLRTLISIGHLNIQPGDLLKTFACLRTLHIQSAKTAALAEWFHQLKHLRYLSLRDTDISELPENIGNMKFLQYLGLGGCRNFVNLPRSIVKLEQLRYLNLNDTSISGIPRGFCVLTNLRKILGFPAKVDGDWCSLEELGPLFQLRYLRLMCLDNVTAPSLASKAKLGAKVHLTELYLYCTSRLGDDGLIKEEEQQLIKEVFDELSPPPSLDYLYVRGYFGGRLPRWMTSISMAPLDSLRTLVMCDLACCTELPDGLCQLPCLEYLKIKRAPAIKHIGSKFLQSYHNNSCSRLTKVAVPFPRLHKLDLCGMLAWEDWQWEQQVQAMPLLEELLLNSCKLRCVPPGLASNARLLRKLNVQSIQHLSHLESFPSVLDLAVNGNPDLERITNLPRLQKLVISNCAKMKELWGVHALQRLVLVDCVMGTLPEYMRGINPRHLELYCSLALLTSVAAGQSGTEWDKFCHFQHVKAYASDGNNPKKWYLLYTREPYSLDTNTIHSFLSTDN